MVLNIQVKALLCIVAFAIAGVFAAQVKAQGPGAEQTHATECLLQLINDRFKDIWQRQNLTPSDTSRDHVLLRRVTLDLVGRVPTEAEVREYLADASPDKYARTVERLLQSAEFHRHLAVELRQAWLPQLETQEFVHLVTEYQHWLRSALARNVPYDQLVYQQLTPPIHDRLVAPNPLDEQSGSPVFLTVADMDPAKLAANSMRAFLGLNLDCAQCHDHPFSRWSRDQFWQSAAFFSRQYRPVPDASQKANWCIQVEGTERVVDAAFLDQTQADFDDRLNVFKEGRRAFADWTVDSGNPYFADNAVNRIWNMLLGNPLVSPMDDLTEIDRATLGPLLSKLSEEFKANDYQLVPLIHAVVLSQPYQLQADDRTTKQFHEDTSRYYTEQETDHFASRTVRMISSTQLVNSLRTASGLLIDPDDLQRSSFAQEFVSNNPSDSKRSTVQALMMMNGDLVKKISDPKTSPLIVTLVEADYLTNKDKIDSLFLRCLSRFPTEEEQKLVGEFFDSQQESQESIARGYADLLWTLVNTAEFHVIQ